ncbi:MAG: SAM-dependent methyltransferase [Bacteroidetes bacterium]|nr:SAM-dependent methyltransferase [Bacteroidota bacterium]
MDKLHFFINYLKYNYLKTNEHGLHSPFVFELYNQVFKKNMSFYSYEIVEDIRSQLLSNPVQIQVTDLGAGSGAGRSNLRSIRQITKTAAKNKKYAQLLFRLADHFQPDTILELGTNVGISTMYLAIARSKSRVITIEGCPEIRKIAQENFKQLQLQNIEPVPGNFDTELPKMLATVNTLDLVFFDGNHRKEATLNYFYQCLEKATGSSVFIFDDIYWSKGMTEAWESIKAHPEVSITLDLFQMGIVFFRTGQVKQHFVLKY